MEWSDEGIILGVRAHGETAAVAEILTREHGRTLGLVHGGRSRRLRPVLQPGCHVEVTWKARLADQLGFFTVEPRQSYAATLLDNPLALSGLTSLAALAHLVPERDPHPNLYEVTMFVLGFLDDDTTWPALMVRWEIALLDELGFGLDLSRCAVTGSIDHLLFVSPKSGRAVSETAGRPYRDKLLALPPFLRPRGSLSASTVATASDVADGMKLTAFFLRQRVMSLRDTDLPEPRQRLAGLIEARR